MASNLKPEQKKETFFVDVFKQNLKGKVYLYTTAKFKDLLQKVPEGSKIKTLLLQSFLPSKHVKLDNPNFLDIFLEKDVLFISYLDKRTVENKAKTRAVTQDLINPFHRITDQRREEMAQSYLKRLDDSPRSNLWDNWFSRTRARAGKVLSKLLDLDKLEIQTHEVETFLNLLKTFVKQQSKKTLLTFEIVKGDAIAYYYNEANNEERGPLANSCMKFGQRNHLFNLYTKNPNQISLLIKHNDNNKICGRAILWTVEGKTYIDRVYYTNEKILQDFIKYANSKGFISIYSDEHLGYKLHLDFKTNEKFEIQLDNWNFHAYPYMDTTKYLYVKEGILSNINDLSKYRLFLIGTNGIHNLLPGSKIKKCSYRNRFYAETEVIQCGISYNEKRKKYCNIYDVSYISHLNKFAFPTDLNGYELALINSKEEITYAKSKDVVYSKFYGRSLLKNQSKFSETVNSFVFKDTSEEELQRITKLHRILVEKYKGRLIRIKPDVYKIMRQNGYFISNEAVKKLLKITLPASFTSQENVITDNGFIINGIFVLASAVEIVKNAKYVKKPSHKSNATTNSGSFYERMAKKTKIISSNE